ncbi:MAG: TIGR02444 family protein [Sphingomonadales bacterium]
MNGEEAGFWLFSLALYGQGDVQDACLRLQNEHGADVNLLLWCCWMAWDHGLIVEPPQIEAANARVKDWRENILKPLRTVRAAAKGEPESYEALKNAELIAERHAQALISADNNSHEEQAKETAGLRLSYAHQAMRNYLIQVLGLEDGAVSPSITVLLNGLRAL